MPEPEALVLMLLSVGLALAGIVPIAISKKRPVALASGCGCLLVLLAAPGLFLAFRWIAYWAARPGPEEIRAALPGEWIGEGRWASDRLVIAPDLTVVQTVQRPDGTRLEQRGQADSERNDLAVISGIEVPSDDALRDPKAAPTRWRSSSEGPWFRFERESDRARLILQNPDDSPYVLRKLQPAGSMRPRVQVE